MRARRRTIAALLASLPVCPFSACTVWMPPAQATVVRHSAERPATTAALLSNALTLELCKGRTSPAAVVDHAPDGCYEVECVADGRGRWRTRGSHRVWLTCTEPDFRIAAVTRVAPERATSPPTVHARIHVRIRPDDGGSCVEATMPASRRLQVTELLDRTFALAASTDLDGPGADEPNLRQLRLARVMQQAVACSDMDHRQARLRRALRIDDAPIAALAELAEFARARGDVELALRRLRAAALRTADPHRRARLAAAIATLRDDHDDPERLRHRAVSQLFAGDLQQAERTLHTVRREHRDAGRDYDLLSRLHRQRGDHTAALAAELLAREHHRESEAGQPAFATRAWTERLLDQARRGDRATTLPLPTTATPPR